jgi:hypothetical protein
MRLLLAATLLATLVPTSADARRKKTVDVRSAQVAEAKARLAREQKRERDERARAEAELAEVRSGNLSHPSEPDRDFPTQQLDDKEVPPSARR